MNDLTIAIGVLALVFLVGGGVYAFALYKLASRWHALGYDWRESIAKARKELQ